MLDRQCFNSSGCTSIMSAHQSHLRPLPAFITSSVLRVLGCPVWFLRAVGCSAGGDSAGGGRLANIPGS